MALLTGPPIQDQIVVFLLVYTPAPLFGGATLFEASMGPSLGQTPVPDRRNVDHSECLHRRETNGHCLIGCALWDSSVQFWLGGQTKGVRA
jgi:hypothetical protein